MFTPISVTLSPMRLNNSVIKSAAVRGLGVRPTGANITRLESAQGLN
ncbi:hypothetical protein [Methylomagnum sp.]